MKKYLLLSFLVISSKCFAQIDYRQGYIIKSENDTTWGYINYVEKSKQYTSCSFKTNPENSATNFTPDQLLGYGFINDKGFKTNEIRNAGEKEKVFTEIIVYGSINLYRYQQRFFVEKHAGVVTELISTNKNIDVEGLKYNKKSFEYISVLRILMADCNEIRSKIDNTQLHEKSLTEIVQKYNTCIGDSYTDLLPLNRSSVN